LRKTFSGMAKNSMNGGAPAKSTSALCDADCAISARTNRKLVRKVHSRRSMLRAFIITKRADANDFEHTSAGIQLALNRRSTGRQSYQ
jgi:hypothetical protein